MAYITDSSFVGDNGLIAVDLASGRSWRRLDQHPSTLPEPNFIPIVEGQPLLNRPKSGTTSSRRSVPMESRLMLRGSGFFTVRSRGEAYTALI